MRIYASDQHLYRWTDQPSEAPSRAAGVGLGVRVKSGAGATNLFHLDGERISADAQPGGDLAPRALFGIEQSPGLRREVAELGNADTPPLPLPLDLRPEVFRPDHGVILALDLSVGHRDSRRKLTSLFAARHRRCDLTRRLDPDTPRPRPEEIQVGVVCPPDGRLPHRLGRPERRTSAPRSTAIGARKCGKPGDWPGLTTRKVHLAVASVSRDPRRSPA